MESKSKPLHINTCSICAKDEVIGPYDAIISCSHCKNTSTIKGTDPGKYHVLSSLNISELLKSFRNFILQNIGSNKHFMQRIEVIEKKLFFLPIWTAKVSTTTKYTGYKTVHVPHSREEIYRDSDGKTRTRLITEYGVGYQPIQDELHTEGLKNILARKEGTLYGITSYLRQLNLNDTELLVSSKVFNQEFEFLSAELSQEEFELAISTRTNYNHSNQVAENLTEVVNCTTTSKMSELAFVWVPFALIFYKYRGSLHRCALDAHTGKVVRCELPISRFVSLVFPVLGLLGTLLVGVGAELASMGITIDVFELLGTGIISMVVGGFLTVLGFWPILNAQSEKGECLDS